MTCRGCSVEQEALNSRGYCAECVSLYPEANESWIGGDPEAHTLLEPEQLGARFDERFGAKCPRCGRPDKSAGHKLRDGVALCSVDLHSAEDLVDLQDAVARGLEEGERPSPETVLIDLLLDGPRLEDVVLEPGPWRTSPTPYLSALTGALAADGPVLDVVLASATAGLGITEEVLEADSRRVSYASFPAEEVDLAVSTEARFGMGMHDGQGEVPAPNLRGGGIPCGRTYPVEIPAGMDFLATEVTCGVGGLCSTCRDRMESTCSMCGWPRESDIHLDGEDPGDIAACQYRALQPGESCPAPMAYVPRAIRHAGTIIPGPTLEISDPLEPARIVGAVPPLTTDPPPFSEAKEALRRFSSDLVERGLVEIADVGGMEANVNVGAALGLDLAEGPWEWALLCRRIRGIREGAGRLVPRGTAFIQGLLDDLESDSAGEDAGVGRAHAKLLAALPRIDEPFVEVLRVKVDEDLPVAEHEVTLVLRVRSHGAPLEEGWLDVVAGRDIPLPEGSAGCMLKTLRASVRQVTSNEPFAGGAGPRMQW